MTLAEFNAIKLLEFDNRVVERIAYHRAYYEALEVADKGEIDYAKEK